MESRTPQTGSDDATFDYYSHHATVSLDRPVVVAGMVPFETRRLGYRVAALHGLRYSDVERALEHRFGASVAELNRSTPHHELRRSESETLHKTLSEGPFGVVTMSDQALGMRANRALVQQRSFYVVLHYTAEDCYQRFQKLYPESAPGWISDAPSGSALRSMYDQWIKRFDGANLVIPMKGLSWEGASSLLVDELEKVHGGFARN